MSLRLRPATPADEAFARETHHLAYRGVVERQFGPWNETRQDALFAKAWSGPERQIMEWNGVPCGYVLVEIDPTRVQLHELVVHPGYQGKGIGTAFLQRLVAEAERLGSPIHLQVLRENAGAAALYRRLGFEEYDTTSTHRKLWRQPTPPH